ncbi:DsbA family protein [Sphingosinicella rhizophila]|uniref:Thioredoxin domain-containing protein n=1 Tax=Sphingosinicella rhizophila TaxID=3050082 RepID=A0ABU3Q6Y6_9SPHN|nr:thioredoxin domain-containing protein [Sphingosinicella sp. GR2756]MDT9599165.1 thioredoxin domain-containing protein [Sphingosinicella sp. GR2756]
MRLLISATMLLLVAACGSDQSGNEVAGGNSSAPLPQIQAPNGDWTQTVVETAEGGFRMGNPDAPVKLVEYGSFTCGHCAVFTEEASAPLRDTYVKSGQVSWEFRPYLLFPTDPGLSMLLRCQGAGPFFRLTEQLYADQPNWMARLQALPPEQLQQLEGLSPQDKTEALVRAAGLDQFFRQRGMPEAKLNSCLSDPEGLQKVAAITEQGNKDGVTGTPSFFINGKIVENASSWAALEPKLRQAVQ